MRLSCIARCVGVFLVSVTLASPVSAEQRYAIEDLGPALNIDVANESDVVVVTRIEAGLQRAAVIAALGDVVVIDLLPDGNFVIPLGSNGTCVVGYASTGAFGLLSHAFAWCSSTGMRDLGTLGDATLFSACSDINAQGRISCYGTLPTATSVLTPYYLPEDDSGPVLLTTLGGASGFTTALNTRNTIVGDSDTSADETRATLWYEDGTPVNLTPDPATRFSLAFAVNDLDEAVGVWVGPQGSRGFRWRPSTGVELLEPLPDDTQSSARGNNDLGVTVGQCYRPNPFVAINDHETACLWGPDSVPVDLQQRLVDGEGWSLTTAVGITNLGTIAGLGEFNGETHAFVLHPVEHGRPPRHRPRHRQPQERVCRDYAEELAWLARHGR